MSVCQSTRSPAWPDVETKSSPNFLKVTQKLSTANFTRKEMCSNIAQNVTMNLVNFVSKFATKNLQIWSHCHSLYVSSFNNVCCSDKISRSCHSEAAIKYFTEKNNLIRAEFRLWYPRPTYPVGYRRSGSSTTMIEANHSSSNINIDDDKDKKCANCGKSCLLF